MDTEELFERGSVWASIRKRSIPAVVTIIVIFCQCGLRRAVGGDCTFPVMWEMLIDGTGVSFLTKTVNRLIYRNCRSVIYHHLLSYCGLAAKS